MLVGLTTIGSDAQSVASSPRAGLSRPADSSGLTWAWIAMGRLTPSPASPKAAQAAIVRSTSCGASSVETPEIPASLS